MTALARRPNDHLQERFQMSYDHAQAADVDFAIQLFKFERRCRITRVFYNNVTGLAENAANHAKIQVKNGLAGAVAAEWDTNSAGAGDNSIPANVPINLTLSATDANRNFAVGDILVFAIDESGTTTVPAGRVVIEGIYY